MKNIRWLIFFGTFASEHKAQDLSGRLPYTAANIRMGTAAARKPNTKPHHEIVTRETSLRNHRHRTDNGARRPPIDFLFRRHSDPISKRGLLDNRQIL